jgi:hypothetical protein
VKEPEELDKDIVSENWPNALGSRSANTEDGWNSEVIVYTDGAPTSFAEIEKV